MSIVALDPTSCVRGLDFWCPVRTGDWSVDCATGRNHAEQVIAAMQVGHRGRPPSPIIALNSMIRAMVAAGVYGGAEAGFVQRIAEQLRL